MLFLFNISRLEDLRTNKKLPKYLFEFVSCVEKNVVIEQPRQCLEQDRGWISKRTGTTATPLNKLKCRLQKVSN